MSDRSEHYKRVAEMMRLYGQTVPAELGVIPSLADLRLRARLCFEELLERTKASGLLVRVMDAGKYVTLHDMSQISFELDGSDPDLIGMIDGAIDLSVTNTGFLVACGVPDLPLLQLVDENNLAKCKGGHLDETGKFQKPAGHKPPDIIGCLRELRAKNGEQNGDA